MSSLKDINTIFFDYDGTLHDSIHIYAPAFRKAYAYLVKNGYAERREWSDQEISHWLGYNPADMWRAFQPDLNENVRQSCSEIIGEEMKDQMLSGSPKLYTGSLDTLSYLKGKGYHLVFISNCKNYYMECQNLIFQLDHYFEAMYCSEQFDFIPKYEILRSIKDRFTKKMAIVGDRKQDMEAGTRNGLITIGCSYGYALEEELTEADYIIDSIKELMNLL